MSSYNTFAPIYDELMSGISYENLTDDLLKIFEKYGRKPKLLLDAACGTGRFCEQFATKDVSVIGTDISREMLAIAKIRCENLDVLLLNQDISELDLYGTIDGAICTFDSVNHITDKRKLLKFFKKISLFLEKDGIFIFDIISKNKFEKFLCNNTFIYDEKDFYLVWENEKIKNKINITLDFFIKNQSGYYIKNTEHFSERYYQKSEIMELLKAANLTLIDKIPYKINNNDLYIVKNKRI